MTTIRRFIGRTGTLVLLVALAALLGSTVASAGNPEAGSIQRLTFDELPFQPVVNIRDKDEVGYTCVVVVDDTS
jgi:hypothetical protein